MAVIDEATEQLVLRVTFAGTPFSGKTTSLRALADQCGVEVETPEETEDGRTLYFDWMEHVAGNFGGRPIRCQVVSVPGQDELRERRDVLVDQSDSIIFVIDSSPERFDDSWGRLLELRARLAASTDVAPAIVLQANKRDLPDAIPMSRIRERAATLGDVAVHESIASKADGVRVSFVFAVRLALDRVKALQAAGVLAHGAIDAEASRRLLHELEGLAPPTSDESGPDAAVGPEASLLSEGVWPPIRGRILLQDYAVAPARRFNVSADGRLSAKVEGWNVRSTKPLPSQRDARRLQMRRINALKKRGESKRPGLALIIVCEADDRWRLWQLVRRG